MALQKREVEYAKEADDVMALLVNVLHEARAGKSVAEIGASSIGPLIEAVAGIDKVPAELAESRRVVLQTVGFRVGELTDAILG